MKTLSLAALALALTLTLPAVAAEVSGVKLPETVTVEGKTLTLNGAGVRSKLIFKVYVGALYLEQKASSAQAIFQKDMARQTQMIMLRDLEKKQVVDAIREGFENNNKDQLPALQERLTKLTANMPEKLKDGDRLSISYVPGKGTVIHSTGLAGQEVFIEGKDFADALWGVWIGQKPVDSSLKDRMLGLKK